MISLTRTLGLVWVARSLQNGLTRSTVIWLSCLDNCMEIGVCSIYKFKLLLKLNCDSCNSHHGSMWWWTWCYKHIFGVQNTSLFYTNQRQLLWHCCFSSLCDMHCSCHLSPGHVPRLTQAYLSSAVLERKHNCLSQLAVMFQNCVHCTVSISS